MQDEMILMDVPVSAALLAELAKGIPEEERGAHVRSALGSLIEEHATSDTERAALAALRKAAWAADIHGRECHIDLWWPKEIEGRAAIKAVLAVLRTE